MCLSGTGKTAVASALASELDPNVISSDVVRKELAGLAATEQRHETREDGIYSPNFLGRPTRRSLIGLATCLSAEHPLYWT